MLGLELARKWKDKLRSLLVRSAVGEVPLLDLEALLYEADLSADLVGMLLETAGSCRSGSREEILSLLSARIASATAHLSLKPAPMPVPGAVLLVGVNGSGKTTAAAKLAQRFRDEGRRVVLAAADTFRAGAIEQLRIWAERTGADIVAQREGADPASVVFDAWQRAVATEAVLVADTAGRMHTKAPLMEEIKKVVRVLGKDGRGAPHEVLLVLDGITGRNALAQSREFMRAVSVTGLIVTKMDGSAKGGGALSAALELSLPIRYLGTGETAADLVPFDAALFAAELFNV